MKRSHGTRTKDGGWRIRITITDEFGRKKQKGFEGRTLASAEQKQRAYEAKYGRVTVSEPNIGTVKQVFEDVELQVWKRSGAAHLRSMNLYRAKWEKAIGDANVDALTSPVLTRTLGAMDLKSRSAITKAAMCIKQALAYAVSDLGWLTVNPAEGIRLPKAPPPRLTYAPITLAEYNRMLDLAEPRCKLLVRLIGECGLRPIEAKRVRAEHLFAVRDRWMLTIPQSKTTAGIRTVPVPDTLSGMIQERKDSDWEGVKDPPDYLRGWWRENSKTRLYDLRGWCSDNWRRRGISDQIRTYLMGHTKPSFTQSAYESLESPEVLDAFFPA